MRRAALAVIAAAALLGCDPLVTASSDPSGRTDVPAAGETQATASPTLAAPRSFSPGAVSHGGVIVSVSAGRMTISEAGRSIDVDLSHVFDVWRETSVPASALEVGDEVFINGDGVDPFRARYVWANIGRIDGVIEEVYPTGMLLEVHLHQGGTTLKRIDFSPYIVYGADTLRFSPADVVAGREVGLVVYGRPGTTLRATRIWPWPVGSASSRSSIDPSSSGPRVFRAAPSFTP